MKITVTVEDATSDFQNQLLDLLAKHTAHVTVDTTWTLERATRYYRELPPRARNIIREAVIHDGWVKAEELREDGDGSLRGHSGALKRTLERGVRHGWWPDGMTPPIQAQGPGFGKVQGYLMPLDIVGVFFTAVQKTEKWEDSPS